MGSIVEQSYCSVNRTFMDFDGTFGRDKRRTKKYWGHGANTVRRGGEVPALPYQALAKLPTAEQDDGSI
jgi:hypothetical protein